MTEWDEADAYERFMGRWSRPVARVFVEWLEQDQGNAWLDVGCGTGSLTQCILDYAKPSEVKGVDASEAYVEAAGRRITTPRADFAVCDAEALCVKSGSYDVVVSGLCLNFVGDAGQGVREMARAVRPGGVAASYVWDYAGGMEMLRMFWDAAVALALPGAVEADEGRRFPICQPQALRALFEACGLAEVQTRAIDVPMAFSGFEDFWEPFRGGAGPAGAFAAGLDLDQLDALRMEARRRFGNHPGRAHDGSVRMSGRAWAVRGVAGQG